MNPTLKCFALFLLFLSLSGSSSAQQLSKGPEDPIAELSIQLNKKIIQANSLEDQIFPMLVSSKINKVPSPLSQNPIDLVCVFEIKYPFYSYTPYLYTQMEDIRKLLKRLLPLMTDQDRLAVVLFYRPSPVDNLLDVVDRLPITEMPSLTNTTAQNWESIIFNVREKMIREEFSTERGVRAALKILNQRNETNRTTGIFLSTVTQSESDYYDYGGDYEVVEARQIDEIDQIKEYLKLQDQRLIIQKFQGEPEKLEELGPAFAENLAALRAGIVESQLLIKPEESELLKDVKISFLRNDMWRWGWQSQNETLMKRSLSVKSGGREEFFFDLKIPKITAQDFPESPVEVRVASYQLVFLFENGSQTVIKNADLMVKIVREGEEISDADESKEKMKDFYHKLGKDWMVPEAWNQAVRYDYEEANKILRKYKDSLNDSIVKDDEMLQNLWKEAEWRIIDERESGVEYD